jgi:hypothetical protein
LLEVEESVKDKKPAHLSRSADSAYDSIQMYLKEIGQYPLINAAKEKELAKRIQAQDMEAKNLLAKANLRLVVSIAKKYDCPSLKYSRKRNIYELLVLLHPNPFWFLPKDFPIFMPKRKASLSWRF